ncbi:MAG: polysaccharide deacetylase family protein [Chloroflexi bacterium]|nr:polysaccharide deacetylase family protein [Chloroflexota bacterium]
MLTQTMLPKLLHQTLLRDQLTILMYHAVIRTPLEVPNWCFIDEAAFRSQVKYLKRHFEVVHLSQAVGQLRNGGIHKPTAVITFDDGFQNNYDVAFPILCEAGIPATIFLTTGLVNTNDTVWFCRLNRALAKTSKPSFEWDGSKFDLAEARSKSEMAAAIQGQLKKLHNAELLSELRRIIVALGDDPDCSMEADSPYRMLSREAIMEMTASGLIEFGAHTHTHAILSRLPHEEQQKEITQSVTITEELTGRSCKVFAYPNGSAQDYDKETLKILQGCDIRAAVTTIEGPTDGMTPVMEMKRYGIGPNLSMNDFRQKVHHYWFLESSRLASETYGPLVLTTLQNIKSLKNALRKLSKPQISQG